jgi:hypothetical protein
MHVFFFIVKFLYICPGDYFKEPEPSYDETDSHASPNPN